VRPRRRLFGKRKRTRVAASPSFFSSSGACLERVHMIVGGGFRQRTSLHDSLIYGFDAPSDQCDCVCHFRSTI
jgi:hypothetical protein